MVKYIAALLVVNGHLFIFGNPQSPVSPFMDLGACCVSIFFFFSGYGLMSSYRHKGDEYMRYFIKKRIIKVLIPLITAYVVTLPIYAFFKGPVDWHKVLMTVAWGGPYLRFSWYVTEIVALYFIFYIVMKPCYNIYYKRNILTISVFLLIASLIFLRQSTWYIISLPGFIMGIWYEEYEKKFARLLSFNGVIVALLLLWFFNWQWRLCGAELLTAYRWEYLSYFVYNAAFVCLVVGVINKLEFTPPYLCITHSSYECYLMQHCAMIISAGVFTHFLGYWLASMSLTMIIGLVMHKIDLRLNLL